MYESENLSHPPPATDFITRAELERRARLLGTGYTFKGAAPAPDEAVLAGRFNTLTLRPGLILHAAEVRDLCSMGTHHMLHSPCIKIGLVIDGATDVAFGHRRFRLGPQSRDRAERDKGALVSLTEPTSFSRQWLQNRTERKVSLTLTHDWLEEGVLEGHANPAELGRFVRTHLDHRAWTLTPRARGLAQQILAPSAYLPGLHRLMLEGHCIELAVEALGALMPGTPLKTKTLSARERNCLARVEELFHEDRTIGMTMADIAKAVGSNPTTLQALSRLVWNTTVFERLRTIRMEKARSLLDRGASVTEAAEAAGYASATNFATAFRQRFNTSPSSVRRRIHRQ